MHPQKGELNGACNRAACQKPNSATWYNHSTHKYYCENCAQLINHANANEANHRFGHDLCTLAVPKPVVTDPAIDLMEKQIRAELNNPLVGDAEFEQWMKKIRPTKQYANNLKTMHDFGDIRFEEGKKSTRHSLQAIIDEMPENNRKWFSHPLNRMHVRGNRLLSVLMEGEDTDSHPGYLLDYAYLLANLLDSYRRRHPDLSIDDLVRATQNIIRNGSFSK